MQIPFLDLKRQYVQIQKDMDREVHSVLEDQVFVGGTKLSQFESLFANAHHQNHGIGVANATDALFIVLKAMGISEGDEVIVPAHGWLSAAEMVKLVGAKVVFVDVELDTFGIDPTLLKSKINGKTKAVIAIHLYGQICRIEEISQICAELNINLIEDCAQAHFSLFNGKYAGQWSKASIFSFYPSKILGAYGDGGAILTHDSDFAIQCRMLANHGGIAKNDHQISGMNSRLDSLQAAVLIAKMNFVYDWIHSRNKIADYYSENLEGVGDLKTPKRIEASKPNFHIYTIQTRRRDELKEHLERTGISTEIHYPSATPLTKAFNQNYLPKDFPVSFKLQNHLLSLPIYPELTIEELAYIVEQIKVFYK